MKMRKLLATAGLVAAISGSSASAALLVYEPFDYSTGSLLGQTNLSTGNNWLRAGTSTNPTAINVVSGSLTPPVILQPAVGNSLAVTGVGDGNGSSERLALPSAITTGQVYYSLSLRIDSLTGSNNVVGGFSFAFNNTGNSATTTNPTVAGAKLQMRLDPTDGTKYNIGIFSNQAASAGATSWSGPLNVGDTQFIVASYEFIAGAPNDTARIWINPAAGDLGQPVAPAPSFTFTSTSGTDMSSVSSIIVRQSAAPQLTLDEVRVGDDWASVTDVPEPTFAFAGLAALGLLARRRA